MTRERAKKRLRRRDVERLENTSATAVGLPASDACTCMDVSQAVTVDELLCAGQSQCQGCSVETAQ